MNNSIPPARLNINIKPMFDILDEMQIEAIHKSAIGLLSFYLRNSKENELIECTHEIIYFWPSLGKFKRAELLTKCFELYLLPLNRVGAEQGFSGTCVFVAYFLAKEDPSNPSNPLIVKFGKKDTWDKLQAEKDQADSIKPYIKDGASYFAFPVHFEKVNDISLLWAPFSSDEVLLIDDPNSKPKLKENNLWKLFEKLDLDCSDSKDCELIAQTLSTSFDALHPIHFKNSKPEMKSVNMLKEYEWYLRKPHEWTRIYENMWGNISDPSVMDFGLNWSNPSFVLEMLSTYEAEITFGCIHGDFHPRNVVFSHERHIKIIDFGWTSDNGHIIKDFALMECNLRFMMLRPEVPFNDLLLLSTYIMPDDDVPKFSSSYSSFIVDQINILRGKALVIIKKELFFKEYVIPLFLISFGLLRHQKNCNNIISFRLTVLQLAKYIKIELEKVT